jgi:hypothetical protein
MTRDASRTATADGSLAADDTTARAAAGRSRGTLWAPGFVVTSVGLAAALWLRDGRMPDSFQFLALAVMALGLGGVLAALLAQLRGFSISAMSVSLSVLLFGVFALLEQQAVKRVRWPDVGVRRAARRVGAPTSLEHAFDAGRRDPVRLGRRAARRTG